MSRLLVVEDQGDSFALIRGALGAEHILDRAASIKEAKEKLNSSYDMAIVDIGLPDGDGYEFCDWLRMEKRNLDIPVVFLTAKQNLDSRVMAFSVGGDDFISKPFNVLELRTRVNAKLKRNNIRSKVLVEKSGIQINLREQTVKIVDGEKNQNIDLTPIEFKILNALMSETEKAFSRDELLNEVWGQSVYVYPRSVDTHVSKLRKKMEKKAHLIKSIHGLGYKFSELAESTKNAV